ncbi:hypothetical protein [Streptomyces sp. NPDC055692]|uniref:hypothetical protein n=1 Tax=Streptomyces sp. NPDC055692 TaxID=3155683 RepID=UPI00343FB175
MSKKRETASARAAKRALRVRRLTWWHRIWGSAAVLLGVAAVTATVVLLASVPDLLADVRAFRAARPCPITGPVASGLDCLRSVPATVEGKVIREQTKNNEYTLMLRGSDRVPASLDMGWPDPLLRQLNKGDTVTLTVWRDYTTAVIKDGVTQESADTPVGEPEFVTALALALLAVGLYGIYAGTVATRHATRHAQEGLPVPLVTLGIQAFWSALAALPALMAGDLTGPVGVVMTWLALLPLIRLIALRLEPKSRGPHSRPHPRAHRA